MQLVWSIECDATQKVKVVLESSDVVMGNLSMDRITFLVDGRSENFQVRELREWRSGRLLLTDGSVIGNVRFADVFVPVAARSGIMRLPANEVVQVTFSQDEPALKGFDSASLNEFQKEAIKAASGLTMQFILIAVGVFSLAGTYLARRPGDVMRLGQSVLAACSLLLLGLSVAAGYLVHSSIIGQLEGRVFSAYFTLTQLMGLVQLLLFLAGGVLFSLVVWNNTRRQGTKFRLYYKGAKKVVLVGTFNNWGGIADISQFRLRVVPLRSNWSIRILLPAGTYEYLFLVETTSGKFWMPDPACSIRVPNSYGGENCVIRVI
jgi:hypothetical protein